MLTPSLVLRRAALSALAVLLACGASTDLTVPPPPKVDPSFKVELPPPLESGRLPAGVRPTRYALDLEVDPAAPRFSGSVRIELALERSTGAIVLHASGLTIGRAEIVYRAPAGEERVRAESLHRRAAGADKEEEELVLVAASAIPAGNATVHLEFTGPLDDKLRGLYRVRDGDRWYAFTQFEPSDARRMFPCFDDPVFKVPYALSVTVPTGNLAFSNTRELERTPLDGGKKVRFQFGETEPMPSYLVALAAGPLEVREGSRTPVPIRLIAAAGRAERGEAALAAAAEHLAILTAFFEHPYPYDKLDLVAVPNFGPGAMENAGLVTFREELVLVPPDASAKAKRDMATVIAHELAHQWFGNLVTMKWWDDLWLNEGFAAFMEARVVDRWKPAMDVNLETLSQIGWVMGLDALDSARKVRQPVANTYQAWEAFDGITYHKGAAVIGMVESWLGEPAFRAGLKSYLRDHAGGNAEASDMFAALGTASGEDVAAVASSFVDQPGVPLVRATLECPESGAPRVSLSQQRYRARASTEAAARDPLWRIPVCIEHGAAPSARTPAVRPARVCALLGERSTTIELSAKRCPAWINPNAGYAGYYRYALPLAGVVALDQASASMDARARVGFLSNAWSLVQAGELPADALLDLLADMKRETRRPVVEELIAVLARVSDALVEDEARPAFEAYASALLLPSAKRLGWDSRSEDDEDTRLLRRSLLTALAQLTDDPWMAREARKRTDAYFTAPAAGDPDTAAIALRVSARRGDVSFEQLLASAKGASSVEHRINAVRALASFREPAALERTLGLLLDGTIQSGDGVYIMRTLAEWPDTRALFVRWLESHAQTAADRFAGWGLQRMVGVLGRLCDPSARTVARSLEPIVAKSGSERRLRESLEAAELCIDLRARQAKSVSDYLKKKRGAR